MGAPGFSTSDVGDALAFLGQSASTAVIPDKYEPDFWTAHALREVYSTYGDVVEIKPKSLHKFGLNELVGTSQATLMTLPSGVLEETYATTNALTHLSSSDAGDTQVYTVEGHTISGGLFTFVVQTVTATGQTKVALTTPLARCSRVANLGATDNAGTIYVFEDDTLTAGVPDTAAKIHTMVPPLENQTLKAAMTISNGEYNFVTGMYASVNKKTAAGGVIRFRVRTSGGVFRTLFKRGINSAGAVLEQEFRPYILVPQNSDVIMTAEADGASTAISAGWNSVLARVRVDY